MKKDKINNIFMLIMFFCLLAYGMLALIRTPKEISYTENRNLNKFQQFTAKGFIDGTYQTGLENAFTDQFIGGGRIKNLMNKNLSFSRYMVNIPALCEDAYISVGNNYYLWDCKEQLLNYTFKDSEEVQNRFEKLGKKYSELNKKYNMNYYYITSPKNYNLKENKLEVDIFKVLEEYWTGEYNFDYLKVENTEELLSYYYKNDHHWNYIGSYEGYKEIMTLLNQKNEIKTPLKKVTFDFDFFGSASRVTSIYDYNELFEVYKFDYEKHKVYINGVESSYGKEEEYFNGEYNIAKETNHYGEFYGGDFGEVKYDFEQPKKENVLIIGNSFTNAVNKLIASGFNKTYIVDLRHYEGAMGEKFNIDKYIEKNDIDKVLIIMDYSYMIGEEFDMWGEK